MTRKEVEGSWGGGDEENSIFGSERKRERALQQVAFIALFVRLALDLGAADKERVIKRFQIP